MQMPKFLSFHLPHVQKPSVAQGLNQGIMYLSPLKQLCGNGKSTITASFPFLFFFWGLGPKILLTYFIPRIFLLLSNYPANRWSVESAQHESSIGFRQFIGIGGRQRRSSFFGNVLQGTLISQVA